MSWLSIIPPRIRRDPLGLLRSTPAGETSDELSPSTSPPAEDFEAELRAYRQLAERKLRASRQADRARPPALRPYRGSEHLLSLICPPQCALCDAPVAGVQQAICARCEASALPRQTALSFGPVWSPFQHNELSRRAVSRFKFHGERWRGYQLAQHAALTWYAELDALLDENDRLVAIPLSAKRIRQRGFNQAQVLVRGIQQRLRLRSCERSLFRPVDTAGDQKHRSRAERLKQRHLFEATPLRAGQRVWLVDDVITTGATLEDAARCLEDVGVHAIGAVTLTWTR